MNRKSKITTQKLTRLALLAASAVVLGYIEGIITAFMPLPPGVKLGLSNIVTMFVVWVIGPRDAVAVLLARIFLGAAFSGNFSSLFYSLGGGALAILTTIGLKYVLQKNQIWIAGCLSALAHSVGQMAVALLITQTYTVILYLPVMLACSIFTGIFTGLCAQILVKRSKSWKITFN